MAVRVDHAVTSGTFSLDGETFDVDNNVWVVGDEAECIVIDAPHSTEDILAVVGQRTVKAIVCTHAQDDHVSVAPVLRDLVAAPILQHPDDRPLWELAHGAPARSEPMWDIDLVDGAVIEVAGTALQVLHTPATHPVRSASTPRIRLRLHRRHGGAGRSWRGHHHRRRADALSIAPKKSGQDP